MRIAAKIVLGVAAVALAAECALIPSEASAVGLIHHSGPGRSPGGTFFNQGQIVNICLSETNESRGYVENNSQVLGNCAPGFTQLSVWADPQGVEPGPAVTVTVTASPSASG